MNHSSNPHQHRRPNRRTGVERLGPATGAVVTVALIPLAAVSAVRSATEADAPLWLNITLASTATDSSTGSDTPTESLSLNFTQAATVADSSDGSDTPVESVSLNFGQASTSADSSDGSDTPVESVSLNFGQAGTTADSSAGGDTPTESLSLNFTHMSTAADSSAGSDTPVESVSLNFTPIAITPAEFGVQNGSYQLDFTSHLYNASDVANGIPDPDATPLQSANLDGVVQQWVSSLLGWSYTAFTVADLDASLPPDADAPGPGSAYDILNLGYGWGNVYLDVLGATGSGQTIYDTLVTPFGNLDLGGLLGGIFPDSGLEAMTTDLPGLEAFL